MFFVLCVLLFDYFVSLFVLDVFLCVLFIFLLHHFLLLYLVPLIFHFLLSFFGLIIHSSRVSLSLRLL